MPLLDSLATLSIGWAQILSKHIRNHVSLATNASFGSGDFKQSLAGFPIESEEKKY